MATFIKIKDIKDGDTVSQVQTMTVPDHLLHKYVNCDWYKSGKWVELKDESNTNIAAAEPIKREDYINVSNDFVSVSIESEKAMKIKPKENVLTVPDEKIIHKGVEPMITNERTITKEENEKLIREKNEGLPVWVNAQKEDKFANKNNATLDATDSITEENKPEIKKRGRKPKS